MSNPLPHCKKIEIRPSAIEGFGVFATDDIAKGEILEEVPFILFPRYTNLGKPLYDFLSQAGFINSKEKYYDNLRLNLKFKDPEKYYFKWFPQVSFEGDPIAFTVLPLGNGPIYNTANVDNNAGWQVKEKTFVFRCEKDIKKDEEIRTFYGYFVTENGAIYNCDSVFNLAFDISNGQARCKAIRFGTLDQLEAARQNPSFARVAQLTGGAIDGLYLQKVSAALPNGEDRGTFEFPTNSDLNIVYQKLAEFKNAPFPLYKFTFQYQRQDTGAVESETVIFKK
jgi:hypothetical protein